jgi:hypothetical protein
LSGISTLTSVHSTGADPDAFKNDNGNTAIIMACSLGKADMVARLLQGGAELNQRTKVLTHWSIKLLQHVSDVYLYRFLLCPSHFFVFIPRQCSRCPPFLFLHVLFSDSCTNLLCVLFTLCYNRRGLPR